ncbi:hypothetical protein ACFRAR_08260 [Kitasatospora sp. NPDC056651]
MGSRRSGTKPNRPLGLRSTKNHVPSSPTMKSSAA